MAVVIPFQQKIDSKLNDGVFKILKPGIEQRLNQELALLEQVGTYLDQRCDQLQIPHLDYEESFQQVREKLQEEIHLDQEQEILTTAGEFYADDEHVLIPALYKDCCTPRVTAMQRVWGQKVTDHQLANPADAKKLAEQIVEALIAKPIFSREPAALFHSDPHAGNLFLTDDGRLAILDWSLVGRLDASDRAAIVQIMLGAVTQDERRIVRVLQQIAEGESLDCSKLKLIVQAWLKKLRQGQFPGLAWLVGLLDEAVKDARLRLQPDLVMFRKSLYTLDGVVAEVGTLADIFDNVLCVEFVRHFLQEWPERWISLPNSREFSTRLSNFDVAEAILSFPSSLARFWIGKGLDLWDDCQFTAKTISPRSQVL